MIIGLFLSKGAGLGLWDKIGTLNRELRYYTMLAEEGHSIIIFSYRNAYPQSLLPNGIKIVTLPFSFIPNRLIFIRQFLLPLIFYRIGTKCKVIITNQAHSGGLIAAISSKIWRTRFIARCGYVYGKQKELSRAKNLNSFLRMLYEKLTFKLSNKCLIPTNYLKEWVVNAYNIKHTKITLLPNYVDISEFKPLCVNKNIDILFVGRLEKVKRLDIILKAVIGLSVKLLFIGKGSLKNELLRFAKDNSIDLQIIDSVENSHLPSFYQKSKIFILPSKWEGHPKSLIEAMACGCICIGSNVDGIKNIITNQKNGLIFEQADDLANTITKTIERPQDYELIISNGVNYIANNFDITDTFSIFKSILNEE